MVDPGILASDILQTIVTLAVPAILWAFLYLVAWEDPEVARESGFGRRTFWLLFPAAVLVTSFGLVPVFALDGVVVGVSVAGGLVPVALSVLFLRRLLGPGLGEVGAFLAVVAAETLLMLLAVLLLPSVATVDLALVAAGIAVPALGFALWRRPSGAGGLPVGAALSLTSAALVMTFFVTETIPGLGIISLFPFYLLAPVVIGVLAGPILRASGGSSPGAALALGYAATTLGTLVGADILREPPLFAAGVSGLYAIGGAGVFDLLYLSGLIAAASAYGYLILTRPTRAPASGPAPATETPARLLRRALDLGYAGRSAESIQASAHAADLAVGEARRLLGASEAPPQGAWYGLGVPVWVEADHRNLSALARSGRSNPVDAGRAWTTARWLVRLGLEVGDRRHARPERRALAFGIDLVLLVVPAAFVWVYLAAAGHGNTDALIASAPWQAAALGYAGYAYLYLTVAEAWTGSTIGKRALGLVVTDRALGRPGPVAAFLRNSTKLVPLLFVGFGGAIVAALAFGASPQAPGSLGPLSPLELGLSLAFLVGLLALAVLGALFFGWLFIRFSREGQRLGDYVAGTWVLNRAAPGTGP